MPKPGRPMLVQAPQGYESFRYRSAISVDGSAPSDFSSIGSPDELRTCASDSAAAHRPAKRASALFRLHQAAAMDGLVTNDLRPSRDSSDAGKIVGHLPSLKDGDDDDDDSASPSLPQAPSTPNTNNERNAGKYTVVAFVNSGSGGGMGPALYKCLQNHLGGSHVFDLHSCKPGNMPEDALLKYAHDPMVRVLACGGDGTCGWIFSSLDKVWSAVLSAEQKPASFQLSVHTSKYRDHLPLAIMPLGTGNDLSRQYGWGKSFQAHMKEKSMISSVVKAKLSYMDRWRCIVMPITSIGEDEKELVPKILEESCHVIEVDEVGKDEGERAGTLRVMQSLLDDTVDAPESTKSSRNIKQKKRRMRESLITASVFDGAFCNYFSLGFDGELAWHFHHEREEHPERFTSPLKNKIIYVQKAPYGLRAPKLSKRVKVFVRNEKGELEKLKVPKSCRAIMVLNIQSCYAGQRLSNKGSPSDGLVEVIFLSNLIRTGAARSNIPFLLYSVAAQTNNVCIRTRCPLYCQVDGEPWLQGEGVIQVKFHSRNAILEKMADGTSCNCMSGSADESVVH